MTLLQCIKRWDLLHAMRAKKKLALQIHHRSRPAKCTHPFIIQKYLQVQGIEEENQVFALKVNQAHLLELSVMDSGGLKNRGRLSDSRGPSGSICFTVKSQ